ncbi:SRPBCC family protein [Paenibacillus sp. WQ 127069]|uniref:SRPBCC family protein n=1 Tax=Paenibacillus baimaensis TaxID=2982185 RepID=A0ABT2UCZ7_9BACL|nr:SRPBCC family protein [Paenibacillus sp. WQ 127069]MCU6792472.1 SRPBCC family protein [Paenibacillus sp. WQ 127069]
MLNKDDSSRTTNGEGSNETVHTRLIDAPREIVFNAWTTPELLAKWWGPKGFTNTFQQFDARPGGLWTFIMHGPNGVDYPNQCMFVEISSPERMVIRHISPVHEFQIIADFEDIQGKTKVTFCQRFETAEELNKLKKLVVPANEENLDRLVEVVRTLTRQE